MADFQPRLLFVLDVDDVSHQQKNTKIRTHIVREALRRKKYRSSHGLSILPSSSKSILPRERRKTKSVPILPSLNPSEDGAEIFFLAIVELSSLNLHHMKDQSVTVQSAARDSVFRTSMTWATHYFWEGKKELAGPFAERAFRDLHDLLQNPTKDLALQLVYVLAAIEFYGLSDLAVVISNYVLGLCKIMLGSNHPATCLARSLYLNPLSRQRLTKGLLLLYDESIKTVGKQSIVSIQRLCYLILLLQQTEPREIQPEWYQLLTGQVIDLDNLPIDLQLFIQRVVSTSLKSQGRFREAANSLRPSYNSLQRPGISGVHLGMIIRNSVTMCSWNIIATEQEEGTEMSVTIPARPEVVDNIDKIEHILQISLEELGPISPETIFALDMLRTYRQRYGLEQSCEAIEVLITDQLNVYKLK